jgi:tetratricopeptide (TPR) repeat protein
MTFVGREAELDLLEREVALALGISSGRTVFVEGTSGAGKTSLVTEFLARTTAQRPELAIARGRCLQTFGSADPYLPFVEAVRDLSDDDATGSIKGETVAQLLAELAPYWLQVVPLVGGLLSATFATAARLKGQSQGGAAPSREALFVQYLELIKKLAAESPLLIVLDDLHWADQSSVALLAHLSRGVARLPVVILGTLRRTDAELEKHPVLEVIRELEREDLAKRIHLGDMGADVLGALLAAEFGGDVSEPLKRWMLETAGGNPLFVSELARLMKQNGAAVEENGEWQLTAAADGIEVPRSAEAVIETRIQHLEPEEIRVLQYASVEGNEFNSTVVSCLLDQDELEMLDVLEKLERRFKLVQTIGEMELPDGDFATTYRFRHALVQTVLYKQVVGKRRILLHRKAGETIESLFQDSLDEVAGKLARHFHQGRVKPSAHRYSRQAADRARLVYAHWEAEELFRIALENSPDNAESADLEERLGDVYDAVGHYQKGITFYENSLAKRSGDAAAPLRLRRKIVVLERTAGITPAPALLQRIRSLIAEAHDHPQEHCLLLLESVTDFPNAVGMQEAVRQALEIAEAEGDTSLILKSLERLAYVLIFFSDRVQEAFPYLQRAKEIINDLGDALRMEQCHTMTAILHARLGQYEKAIEEFQGALEIAERVGIPRAVGMAYNNLGCLLLRIGRYVEAEETLHRAYVIHSRRDRSMLVQSLLNLAQTARRAGNLPLAIERFQQMIECAREFEYWSSEAVAHAGLGLCLLEAGRIEEAREAAGGTLSSIADRDEWFEDREFAEIFLARLARMDGHHGDALQRLQKAGEIVANFDVYAWAHVEVERARILATVDPEAAQSALSKVIELTSGFPKGFEPEIRELQQVLTSWASAHTAAANVT